MENFVIAAIVLVIISLAVFYVARAKKKGKKCIGCPYADCPSRNKGCSCNK